MRVVVGSEVTRDCRQAEIDRHLAAISRSIAHAEADGLPSLAFTLVLRAASSTPAQAVIRMQDELSRAGVSVKVVLANLEPQEDLRELFRSLTHLAPREHPCELIRWARNPRLLDAHEQATYGEHICWSGDAMRRDADKRNALTMFDDQAPNAARLGRLAFEALWAASSLVPERHLLGRPAMKPSGGYHQADEAPVAGSPLRPSLQGWPLVRH